MLNTCSNKDMAQRNGKNNEVDYKLVSTYNTRDLLLFAQYLFISGLIEPSSVEPQETKVDSIVTMLYSHASTQLSMEQGTNGIARIPTVEEMCEVYHNLLGETNCSNTIELANYLHKRRIEELEAGIFETQKLFLEALNKT